MGDLRPRKEARKSTVPPPQGWAFVLTSSSAPNPEKKHTALGGEISVGP